MGEVSGEGQKAENFLPWSCGWPVGSWQTGL